MATTRTKIASILDVAESVLRHWEDVGALPRFGTVALGTYVDAAEDLRLRRARGEPLQVIRGTLSLIEGGTMPVSSNELTYSPWRRLHIAGVHDEKSRCAALLPHFLRGIGHAVVIPTGSVSDFQLPPEAKDSDWWGGRSNGQWFPDECRRYGLLHMQIDAPVGPRTGAPRPATHGAEPVAGGALLEITKLVGAAMAANPKLTEVKARGLVFDARPDLYEAHRKENTHTKKGVS